MIVERNPDRKIALFFQMENLLREEEGKEEQEGKDILRRNREGARKRGNDWREGKQ